MVLKDDSDDAQSQQDRTKRPEAEDNPEKALKLEEDQGYASVLPEARAKEVAAQAQGYAERVKGKDGPEREESSYKRRPRRALGPRKWSTGSCRLFS